MNFMRKNVLIQLAVITLLLVIVYVAHSQGTSAQNIPALAPNTPLDGGIFLLLAAGLVYGGKTLYRKD